MSHLAYKQTNAEVVQDVVYISRTAYISMGLMNQVVYSGRCSRNDQ